MHLAQPTSEQQRVAHLLGISLEGLSQTVAAAAIHDAVEKAIHPDHPGRQPSDKQIAFATSLGVFKTGDTFRVCSAKIDEELYRRNVEALRELDLKPGDRVLYTRQWEFDGATHTKVSEHVVSSIGRDSRVYFKAPVTESGGWPTQLTKINDDDR